MRALFPVLLLTALCGCHQTTQQPAAKDESNAPVRDYALHGEIVRLDAKDKIAVIKHQAIGDWMGAMTMEFPIKDEKEFSALHAGEKIAGTVHVKGESIPVFWVDQIHEEADAPAPAK
jgi:Cu/Ag efflux protein CusF